MIIDHYDLSAIRSRHKNCKIVICAGWFDMFHYGHLQFLNNAKLNGDILVVVVMNDAGIKPLKGNDRPLIGEKQRASIVDNIKSVDYTVISKKLLDINNYIKYDVNNDYKERLIWEEYIPIMETLKPDKIFTLDETIAYESLQDKIKDENIKVVYTDYTEGISTTSIVGKLMPSNKQ